ncbi:MAG TPA: redoxin domain-containing protein [Fibrobacteria bacterium]|nr:redoxin domain-containing protein [Fibrobacteria bacterium]
MNLKTIPVIAALVAGSCLAAGDLRVKVGQTSPTFSMPSLLDPLRRISLKEFADSARYAANPRYGKPVLLAFWNTTCVPCRAEFPRLQKWLANRSDVKFIPWLIEDVDPAVAIQWLQSIGMKETGVIDKYATKSAQFVVCENKLCHVPALVAITPDQKVRLAKAGYDPAQPLEAMLDEVLPVVAVPAEPPVPKPAP